MTRRTYNELEPSEGLPGLTPLLPALDDVGARLGGLGAELRRLADEPEPDIVKIAECMAAVANLSAGLAQDVSVLLMRVEVHLRQRGQAVPHHQRLDALAEEVRTLRARLDERERPTCP